MGRQAALALAVARRVTGRGVDTGDVLQALSAFLRFSSSNAARVSGISERLSQNAGGGRSGWVGFCLFGGGPWFESRRRLRELELRSVMWIGHMREQHR